MPSPKLFASKTIIFSLLLFIVVSFGTLWQVNKRIVADEWLWVPNGVRYLEAIKNKDPEGFHVSRRPGVTVSWISAATTYLGQKFGGVKASVGQPRIFIDKKGYMINRIAFGLLTASFVVAAFLLLKRSVGWQRSLVVSGLIGLQPLTLLKGEAVWTDLLLALFMFLSLASFLNYWLKNDSRFLVASGLLFGLSIATKAAGVTLLPVFLIAPLFIKFNQKTIRKAFFSTVAVIFFGVVLFYLIYPYLWQNPFGFGDRYSELTTDIVQTKDAAAASLFYYPWVFFKADPVVTGGSILILIPLLIEFLRKKTIPFSIIISAVAAGGYAAMLVLTSQFWSAKYGVRLASPRYIIPGIYFLVLFFIESVNYFSKKGFRTLWILPVAALLLNLYNFLSFLPLEISDY
ncbi:MAG: glycosyltransferase family 39 protein [Candidatus Woykebacteria bacterium]